MDKGKFHPNYSSVPSGSVVGLSGLATSETTSGLPITSHKKLNILEVTLKTFGLHFKSTISEEILRKCSSLLSLVIIDAHQRQRARFVSFLSFTIIHFIPGFVSLHAYFAFYSFFLLHIHLMDLDSSLITLSTRPVETMKLFVLSRMSMVASPCLRWEMMTTKR